MLDPEKFKAFQKRIKELEKMGEGEEGDVEYDEITTLEIKEDGYFNSKHR